MLELSHFPCFRAIFCLKLCLEKTPGVIRAASQYGVASRIIDLSVFDLTHHPWRCGGLFDAIVTDPPCQLQIISYRVTFDLPFKSISDGVRAGAKRLGRKKQLTDAQKELMLQHRLSPSNPCVVPICGLLHIFEFWKFDIEMTNHTSHPRNHMNYRN